MKTDFQENLEVLMRKNKERIMKTDFRENVGLDLAK